MLDHIPFSVLSDLSKVLHLLVDAKRDNAQLWEQLITMKEELEQLKAQLTTKESFLAVRQVYHAVNEKLLRRLIGLTGLQEKTFWKKYKTTNIGHIIYQKDLMQLWPTLQQQFNISEAPDELWSKIHDGKEVFDKFVHSTSFQHFPHSELVAKVMPTVFVGELEKFEPAFEDVLALDVALTEGTGKDLYEY